MMKNDSHSVPIGLKRLVHYPLCPHSRFIRLILSEKNLDFSLIEEPFWEKRETFLQLNPSGFLPILVESDNKTIIREVEPIFEYLEETVPSSNIILMPKGVVQRAEIRRIIRWFNVKFYQDVSGSLLTERVLKRKIRDGYPDSTLVRVALQVLPEHMLYIASLLGSRDWLAGNHISAADFAAVAHISVVDFLGNVSWSHQIYGSQFDIVRDWYARMKSRKSFRELVGDVVQGFSPPIHYANPDF